MKNTSFKEGNAAYRDGDFEEAIKKYQESIKKNEFSYYYENLAAALCKINDYPEARKALAKAFQTSDEAGKNRIKKTNHLFSYLRSDVIFESPRSRNKLTVGELKVKLWGGFSHQASMDLETCLSDPDCKDKDKANAAFILAKWHAVNNDWGKASEFVKKVKRFNVKLYRSKKVKLFDIECRIKTGDIGKAKEMIDFVVDQRVEGDFLCAKSNLLSVVDEAGSSDRGRLECLNVIYKNAGLSEISFENDKKGLAFGNIKHSAPEKKINHGPKVSVLVPVYNAEEFIDVAIKSLLCQTWSNIEIIAVEDCGPDQSWSKLQGLAKHDPRLKIYRNDQNLGAYPTRNKALSLATGEFITVHDSDDWSHPQMIELQIQEMLRNPEIKISCSAMARVYPDLKFILRPQRENLEYIHRSYPSVLIRRADLRQLGEWDGVSANADDEFVQRARLLWGNDSVVDVLKDVPLSFFLVHENSLTQQKGTSLNTLTFGIRKEYSRQAAYWRKNKKEFEDISLARTTLKSPFPIPQGLSPKHWPKKTNYDLVLISDLGLLGGTRRCNEGYIKAACELGLRVGIFHWPRYDLKPVEVADEYMELSYLENVDILVPEDEVSAKAVLIHHPPILNFEIDAVPKIACEKVAVLVNQSPMQLWSQQPFYYDAKKAEALCQKLFGHLPTWIPISPRVVQTLRLAGGFNKVHSDIWYPPYNGRLVDEMPSLPEDLGSNRPIRVGRHARNHWTKWPDNPQLLRDAYCADKDGIEVHLLGGAETPQKLLGEIPRNWNVLEFDSVPVKEFVADLDFFVHYTHTEYIEEFGRNIMEAMAAGRVVVLPMDYKFVFGDAAVYAEACDVDKVIKECWYNPTKYEGQALRGHQFVKDHSCLSPVMSRLEDYLDKRSGSK